MEKLDLAVVGSGIGGSLISALNKDKNITLFEQDKNLGGCASTFKRYGNYYNAGATTFVGYEEGHILKDIFEETNTKPNLLKSDIAIRIIQKDKTIDRVKNFDEFLENINKTYPHKNNKLFWSKIKQLDEKFWKLQNIYFGKYSIKSYMKTALFLKELFSVFGLDILKSASSFIDEILYDISENYREFIDAQLLITVQTTSKNISLLSLALGLSYPFHDVFYANGGMGSLIEEIVKDIEVKRKEKIVKIKKQNNGFVLKTQSDEYFSKNVVLNTSVYNTCELFDDESIKKYYNNFSFSDQSAFVVYLTIDTQDLDEEFLHHYQIILEKNIFNCISKSFFVSFSDKSDDKLSRKNSLSVTISTHTKALFWKYLPKQVYDKLKKQTQEAIMKEFLSYFTNIKKHHIKTSFSATAFTFNRYINRYNCGGKAINIKNILELPSTNTPFKGLYNVGDTVFAGQGWPGIAIGASVLNGQLNG